MNKDVFVYQIDRTDTIVSVSDNWEWFADANLWCGSIRPKDVVGHKLWDFVQDLETQLLYQELFKRVREDQALRTILFRCDSPNERRYLELLVESLLDEHLRLTSRIRRTEPRDPVKLLDSGTPRSTEVVTLCSMCKKIKILPEKWVEIEEGLTHLKLFEADKMPQLSHGLCPACYNTAMAELDN